MTEIIANDDMTDEQHATMEMMVTRLMGAVQAEIDTVRAECGEIAFPVQPIAWALAKMSGSLLAVVPEEHRAQGVMQAVEILGTASGGTVRTGLQRITMPDGTKLDS